MVFLYNQCITRTENLQIHPKDLVKFGRSQDNVTGRLSDERYARMSATCEAEQQTLEKRVAELQILMDGAKQKSMNVFRLSTTLLAQ